MLANFVWIALTCSPLNLTILSAKALCLELNVFAADLIPTRCLSAVGSTLSFVAEILDISVMSNSNTLTPVGATGAGAGVSFFLTSSTIFPSCF
jgi:hypothetical protein